MSLYDFDTKLRSLCFDACGQFEILLRNALSETLAKQCGPHPYYDNNAYPSGQQSLGAIKTAIDIFSKTRDPRAKHYKSKYDPPALPPIWVLKEFMTFGQTNNFLKCLSKPLQKDIAIVFGLRNEQVFASWIEALVQLRNVCAHHARLFNHSFQAQPQIYRRAALPTAPPQKLKALLECLDFMTISRGTRTDATVAVGALIARYTAVQPAEVGY